MRTIAKIGGVELHAATDRGLVMLALRPLSLYVRWTWSSHGCRAAHDWPTIVIVDYLSRIAIDPEIRFGKPCVRGFAVFFSPSEVPGCGEGRQ